MRIFITGASGFVGTRLMTKLAGSEHELRCLVRRNSQTKTIAEAGAKTIVGDVSDRKILLQGMRDCDCVIHLANIYSFWERDRSIYRKVNVDGTRNVLECALEAGVKKVVHVSTGGIFGKPEGGIIADDTPPGPIRFSEYFQTKYEGDQIAWQLYEKRGLPLVVIYPAAVMGANDPKATGRYVWDFIKKRLPATVFLDSYITYVYVGDVAESIIRAAEKENNIGERYIIGKHHLTFRDFNKLLSEVSGIPAPRFSLPAPVTAINARLLTWLAGITGKTPAWGLSIDQVRVMKEGFIMDGSKAEKELGITYTSIQAMLEEMVSSYKN